jgi:hypothetical protein
MVRGCTGGVWNRGVAAAVAVVVLGSAACSPGGPGRDDGVAPSTTRRTATSAPPALERPASTSSIPVSSSTSTPRSDLRQADLGSRPHLVRCPGGEAEVQPGVAAPGADGRTVVIGTFEPQFLDLTGDGRPEAVVEVTCRVADEWSEGDRSVIVLADEAGEVVQLGQPLEGADPTVVGGSLAVGRRTAAGEAASGAAAEIVYEPFTFDGATWVPGAGGSPLLVTDPVTVDGIGAVLVGAPFGEAAISTGQGVETVDPLASGACVEIAFRSGPEGVRGRGGDGVIHAVLVDNPAVRTAEGLGVGSTEVEVQFTFPGQVSVLPAAGVPGGQHLIVDFADQPDRVLLFTTDGTTVTDYAAGAAGWADVAEGCA